MVPFCPISKKERNADLSGKAKRNTPPFDGMEPQLNLSESQQSSHTITPPAPTSSSVPASNLITIDQFLNLIQLRTAKIVHVEKIPNKDKLLKLTLQVGNETRTIVSGIRTFFPDENVLVGKMIAIVANLEPKKLGGVVSEGMLLAALDDEGKFSLLVAENDVKSGAEVR